MFKTLNRLGRMESLAWPGCLRCMPVLWQHCQAKGTREWSCSATVMLKINGNAMGNAVQMCSGGPVPHHLGSHTAQDAQICLKKGAKPRRKFTELCSPLAPNLKQLWAQEILPLTRVLSILLQALSPRAASTDLWNTASPARHGFHRAPGQRQVPSFSC